MKASIQTLCPFFNTHRMVQEYTERFYLPARRALDGPVAADLARARALAAWKARVCGAVADTWPSRCSAPSHSAQLQAGEGSARARRVRLGALSPSDVRRRSSVSVASIPAAS